MTTQPLATLPAPYACRRVDVGGGVHINAAVAGDGPPLLLLHGYPQTHLMWRHVAPALAASYTVVATDLRGYGDSSKPAPVDSRVYAKRAMAADQVEVMHRLGFDRFDVIAHDRGARVAHRMVLDRPDVVDRLVALDIGPTRHALRNVDHAMATAYYHWFLAAAGGGVPERLLGADPEFWVRSVVERLLAPGASIEPEVMADYVRCFADPATVAAVCADYRAGATSDMADDDASYDAGERITRPTLALWGEQSFVGRGYDTLAVWQSYADDVRGHALPAGHFLPEEVPDLVLEDVLAFLGRPADGSGGTRG